jgi:dCMP deaminase
MSKQVILYLPVIHAGYLALMRQHADADEVLVLGESFQEQFPWMKKEIRALKPQQAVVSLRAHFRHLMIRVVETRELQRAVWAAELVLPDEEVSHELVTTYGLDEPADGVTFVPTFLRWDRSWSLAQRPAQPDLVISTDERDQRLLGQAALVAGLSSDWWRQVGAVAVRDDTIIAADHNRHLPTEYAPYINGDPRNSFKRGLHIELSTAIHAEAAVVARAAREGLSLVGADLYVTTFPCPGCAYLIAEVGFRSCYYAGPYAVLDGDAVLRQAGVQLIWVKT